MSYNEPRVAEKFPRVREASKKFRRSTQVEAKKDRFVNTFQ